MGVGSRGCLRDRPRCRRMFVIVVRKLAVVVDVGNAGSRDRRRSGGGGGGG